MSARSSSQKNDVPQDKCILICSISGRREGGVIEIDLCTVKPAH